MRMRRRLTLEVIDREELRNFGLFGGSDGSSIQGEGGALRTGLGGEEVWNLCLLSRSLDVLFLVCLDLVLFRRFALSLQVLLGLLFFDFLCFPFPQGSLIA